jgi:hypothetical protein
MKYYWWKLKPYRDRPDLFVREMLGAEPTPQQEEALDAIANGTHVSIKSGHGTGKTAFDAWCILWFCYTRINAQVPCTAPTEAQLKNVLWKELAVWHDKLDPFFKDKFVITSDKFYHKDHQLTWFAVARTARSEKPEALQGSHGENLMFIIEEASGVAEEVFTVVRGALTSDENRCIMTSNPTRTQGFFYNSHTLWDGDPWHCLTFNGEDSPIVGQRYINEIETEYGRDSDVFRVRVLGEFPVESDFTLIPKAWVLAAFDRKISYLKKLGKRKFDAAGVDIARYGDNKTVFCLVRHATVVGILQYSKQNTMETAELIIKLGDKMNSLDIKVDEIGVGGGVVDRCYQRGVSVTGIDVSKAATDKEKFVNKRAEYFWHLRERFEDGSISLAPLKTQLSKADMIKFIEQVCSIRYEYNPTGKVAIWSKERMRRDKIKSPDLADALMLSFAEYNPKLKKAPTKTALQKWSDDLEKPYEGGLPTHEEFVNDFYKMSDYPVEDKHEVEDRMVWN